MKLSYQELFISNNVTYRPDNSYFKKVLNFFFVKKDLKSIPVKICTKFRNYACVQIWREKKNINAVLEEKEKSFNHYIWLKPLQ